MGLLILFCLFRFLIVCVVWLVRLLHLVCSEAFSHVWLGWSCRLGVGSTFSVCSSAGLMFSSFPSSFIKQILGLIYICKGYSATLGIVSISLHHSQSLRITWTKGHFLCYGGGIRLREFDDETWLRIKHYNAIAVVAIAEAPFPASILYD